MTPTISPRIQAVLFDYGMVLSGPPNPGAWATMLALSGLSDEALKLSYWAHRHPYDRGDHTGVAYWNLIAQDNDVTFTADQISRLAAADVALWGDLNLPMVEWAAELQRAGIRTGILSNIGDEMAKGLLAKHLWLEHFTHHTWSYTLNLAKPEAAIYRHAAEGLATSPASILFIDDRADNIEAAQKAGMQTVQYENHDQAQFHERMQAAGFNYLLVPEQNTGPRLLSAVDARN
jgi:putative hydrolase of the HAD superfamily